VAIIKSRYKKSVKNIVENNYYMYYNGMEGIRNKDVKIELTYDQQKEVKKCQSDPIYFIRKYCHIVTLDRGLVKFIPYEYQIEALYMIIENRFTIFNWGRRLGKTSIFAGLATWLIRFTNFYKIGCFADKDEDAMTLIEIVQTMYSNIPMWLQVGVASWNAHSIELENGSLIKANATTSTSGRSKGYNFIYVDEIAHIRKNIFMKFWSAVAPTISSGSTSRILMTSTPDGINHFYDFFTDAEMGKNGFEAFRVTWREHPERDEKWKKEELKRLKGDKRAFAQEHEGDFLGSSRSLIDGEVLKILYKNKRSGEIIESDFKANLKYKVFSEPLPHHKYIIVVDPSEGLGQDYTSINVIDVSSLNKFTQAVNFYDNTVSTNESPYIIKELALKYNNAFVIGENNVCADLYNILVNDLDYKNVYRDPSTGRLGLRTTKETRNKGLKMLKDIIESGKFEIYDEDTIYEFTRFIEISGKFQADEGENDDNVMSLYIFAWFISDRHRFKLWLANIEYMYNMYGVKASDSTYSLMVPEGIVDSILDDAYIRNNFTPIDYDPWNES
jgi:hypothetical protein